ncbi:mitotic checkpoint regulator, MAD2B-interacting domain-containing protein [Hirsutella rhossiliensis]|uniref:Mitotic checkpoint regulator, MAD2B-interacting domain-containing protein n=1 Tax=Hirsutella rhossiliensis TaxID=111463 RepID=A0A9P8MQW0_9HYPO|nr:mitotic checkpoint regulator, MAD2B-interacting domain-containing protein [Hirsutella rhossiliensis]KAH0960613.1 mitotic checkpoint regulator, MAD2B-interacting domain-containing protein [Hirsutella rhossiliensis]
MVLVDYSESDASASESEAPPKPAPAPKAAAAAPKKQAFQKVVDRSNRGKITVSLPQQTSAEPGFRRGGNENEGYYGGRGGGDGAAAEAVSEAPLSRAAETSVSQEQKPADEVKLGRRGPIHDTVECGDSRNGQDASGLGFGAPPAKRFLFSCTSLPQDYAHYAAQTQHGAPLATTGPGPDSLDSIADDLQPRRPPGASSCRDGGPGRQACHQLQHGPGVPAQRDGRAAGEQQIHQPCALQGGKHSLRQLVQNVHNQREALEDSFAKGKSNRKEASSRYGW